MWRSGMSAEKAKLRQEEHSSQQSDEPADVSRRDFLKISGISLAVPNRRWTSGNYRSRKGSAGARPRQGADAIHH